MRLKSAICALLIGVGLSLPAQAAKKEWKTISVGLFTLHTQGSESVGRELLKELLWFWKFIGQRFPGDMSDERVVLIGLPGHGVFREQGRGGQYIFYDGRDTILIPYVKYPAFPKQEVVKLKLKRCGIKFQYRFGSCAPSAYHCWCYYACAGPAAFSPNVLAR